MKHRIGQILIALDQLINAMTPNGWADETLSARSWRERKKHPWRHRIIDGIMFLQKNHCYAAYLSEKKRLQSPPSER